MIQRRQFFVYNLKKMAIMTHKDTLVKDIDNLFTDNKMNVLH